MAIVSDKTSLLLELRQHRQQIMLFGVRQLQLFGSFVHDNAQTGSDIDFLVEFEPGQKTYDNFMDLSFYLENLFGRRVELVTAQSLSKYIGPHILNESEHVF